jgi:hypothetical protein
MTELTIQSSEGYKFLFQVVAPVSNAKIQPSVAVPLPNTSSANQLLFRFFGQQEDLSFDFTLIPSSTDLSQGTAPSSPFPDGVKTVKDQQIYLRDYVYGAQFNIGWWITLPSMYADLITGNIENITFDAPPGSSSRYRTGRMAFKRGRTQGTN